MDISSISRGGMSGAEFQSAISMSMLKKTMDTQEMEAAALTMMLQKSIPSGLGDMIDTYA